MKTEIDRICGIMYTLLEHQPFIDVPYEKINDIAVALVKDGYGKISEYKAEIERLKAEFKQLETNAEILARGVRDLNHENYELTQKLAKQTRIARDANAKCNGAERYLRPFQYKADRLETKCNDLKRLSDWQREEIKRLKAEVNKGCDNCETVKQAQIDALTKLKDSYGLYYLSAFGVKERMLADILNPMIEELKK